MKTKAGRPTHGAKQQIAAQAQLHSTCGVCGGKKTITGVLVPLNAFTNEPFKPTTATIECPDHRPDGAAPQAAGPAQGDLAQWRAELLRWRGKLRDLLGESVDRPAFFNHLAVLERILAAMPAQDVNAELLGAAGYYGNIPCNRWGCRNEYDHNERLCAPCRLRAAIAKCEAGK
ncbi:hypothetical protein LCGC14_1188870 [marine sediment metagenome]|uniref:Uncharacterized protein n=1 Tax=marine sediment metagenome TaxID=412755 RepID=A0A0F9LPW9_9ZZZZ